MGRGRGQEKRGGRMKKRNEVGRGSNIMAITGGRLFVFQAKIRRRRVHEMAHSVGNACQCKTT